jgi:hypothetical protein
VRRREGRPRSRRDDRSRRAVPFEPGTVVAIEVADLRWREGRLDPAYLVGSSEVSDPDLVMSLFDDPEWREKGWVTTYEHGRSDEWTSPES